MLSVTLHYPNFIPPLWIVFFLSLLWWFLRSLMWVFLKDQKWHSPFALFNSPSWWVTSFSWLSQHLYLDTDLWVPISCLLGFPLGFSNSTYLKALIFSKMILSPMFLFHLSFFCSFKPQSCRQLWFLFFHDPSIYNQSLFVFILLP